MKTYLGIVSILCLSVAFECLAQTPPATLEISIQVLFQGFTLPDDAVIHAPADIHVFPNLQTTAPVHAGDAVKIDFYADGKKLSSDKAIWHDEINPSKNARPGETVPMFISPAQFACPVCDWMNVPEGKHVIIVRAYDFHGLSAFSAALHFTVLPPLPPETVSGTHVLTGKQRPPVKPAQVRIFRGHLRTPYEVIGLVTARAPGQWSQDAARAEIKRQAAQMGANGVIIDRTGHSGDWPFSGTNKVFIEPAVHLSGEAVYAPGS